MNLTSVVVEVDQMLSHNQSMEYSLSDDRWLCLEGCWFDAPGMHVKVSLGMILNLKCFFKTSLRALGNCDKYFLTII